mmetsp:Transcript_25373/g.37973  ORF Transcript_25373/g.37973 Transcript_25373/m.37973 type:complete len:111 (-) Transcript_25373:19-351(-)
MVTSPDQMPISDDLYMPFLLLSNDLCDDACQFHDDWYDGGKTLMIQRKMNHCNLRPLQLLLLDCVNYCRALHMGTTGRNVTNNISFTNMYTPASSDTRHKEMQSWIIYLP